MAFSTANISYERERYCCLTMATIFKQTESTIYEFISRINTTVIVGVVVAGTGTLSVRFRHWQAS